MASGNGYISLEALKGLRRLEVDVVIDGVGTFRVQALTQEDVHRVAQAAGTDASLWRQHEVLRGLVKPDLATLALDDLEEAVTVVQGLHPMIVDVLQRQIGALSYQPASQAYASFGNGDASSGDSAAPVNGSSSSANPST